MEVTVIRRETFNSAHRLHNPNWDNQTNERIFGKCNNPNYHGHNYALEVHVKGPVDPETGYVMDMKILRDLIKEEVTDRFDHKNLNLDVSDFNNLNPTAENIAIVIWNRLNNRLNQTFKLSIRLYETERNFVEYSGS